ncbi:hypothetical protein AVEN_184357-1 [Araneus ventricosus]|uniref:Uncharacterized protein n=1 Tax=Araneus ventricosus TaxID=182803 RepID=A0A4Y2IB92_ARAVE|nr:hypothetical protein AVEN_184357-1 [Araneus ventricosus]
MEVLPGRGRKVLTVKVKTQFEVTSRPVQRIYPLEISVDQVDSLKHEMINIARKTVCSGSSFGVNEYGLDSFNQNICFLSSSIHSKTGEDVGCKKLRHSMSMHSLLAASSWGRAGVILYPQALFKLRFPENWPPVHSFLISS